jgi:Rod binding domain-containing protein
LWNKTSPLKRQGRSASETQDMKTFPIAHDQWQTLNQKGAHKPQTDFASTLQQASGARANTSSLQLPALHPLSQDDFEAGDAALPAEAARQLKALDSQDFGANAQADLQPLTAKDYIPGAKAIKDDVDSQLRQQTEKWVGETFYGNLLKQMHDSPFKSALFDGGRGAEAFEPMLDQQISDHIAQSGSNKLVDSIVHGIESKMKKHLTQGGVQDKGSLIPVRNNPYWNERAHVAPGIRA